MKKLLTSFTGGQPIFYPDDLEHIQIGLLESIVEIVKTNLVTPTDPNILNGTVVTASAVGISTTAGSIYWNGEVYLVDAQSLVGFGQLYWQIVETFLAFNPVQFADGNTRNIHAIRKLGITYTDPFANGFLHSNLKTFQSIASVSASIADEQNLRLVNDNLEIATRSSADANLQANINSQAAIRLAQDTALQANIAAEAASRASALLLKMDIAKVEYLLNDIVSVSVGVLASTTDMFITRSHNGFVHWQGSFTFGAAGIPVLTITSAWTGLRPNRSIDMLGHILVGGASILVRINITTTGVITFTDPFGVGSLVGTNSGTIYFNVSYYNT